MYETLRNNRYLNTFIIWVRLLTGFAFIPSGLKKLLAERFTQLGIETQIGFFFEGLYQTGFYWKFLGLGQLIAAFLLMTQRFATIGAVVFFFIISNIWIITVSMNFRGTWFITTLMFLASILLLIWDFHKLKFLFYQDNFKAAPLQYKYPTYSQTWVIAGFVIFITCIVSALALMYSSTPFYSIIFTVALFLLVLITTIFDEFRYRAASKKEKKMAEL